jgi:ferritin-like protein
MGSETYHEPVELLSEPTKEMHRAIVSLIEELEAIDWYQQRADACTDDELRAVILHHKNEEIEHAMMNLEWIRRHSPEFDENIRTYVLNDAPILEIERAKTAAEAGAAPAAGAPPAGAPQAGVASGGSLGLGSLKAV